MLAARGRAGVQEGIDHLFLLPGRALSMDNSQLRQDLAGLDFSVNLLHRAPKGNVWLSGAAPVEANHRQSRPTSTTRAGGQQYHHGEQLSELQEGHLSDSARDASGSLSRERERDKEERARMARERQQNERQKKLEELREQALAAQRFRQQKEEERRKRIDEMRLRDTDRRHQVEERKRAIWEAERDRREAILRRNEEREARLEHKKKSNGNAAVFAFGSSTPRMLEPADTGGTFWGHRRATSTSNVMFAALPLSRRSSERELDPNKKRATSASGLDRQPGEEDGSGDQMPWSRVARRRTDLVPTIPASRDSAMRGSSTPRPPGSSLRSGEVTPGSPSRPGSSMSSASTTGGIMTSSITGAITVNRRPRAAPRRPRPASIAGTGVTTPPHAKTNVSVDGKVIGDKPPLPRVHSAGLSNKKPTATQSPPTPTADKPQVPRRTHKTVTQKSPRVTPRATPLQSPATDLPPTTLQDVTEATMQELVRDGSSDTITLSESQITKTETEHVITTENAKQVTKDEEIISITNVISDEINKESEVVLVQTSMEVEDAKEIQETQLVEDVKNLTIDEPKEATLAFKDINKEKDMNQSADPLDGADMTGSMMARRGVITTEEEAKAALAERRRLAREEAERQAERERLRLEQEAAAEAEKQRQEEERQRRLEEETIRLSALQRQAEDERLQQAILEAQKRAEEENVRKEEEVRAKAEREVAEAKAREEAEKQRKETAQRLQREEQEREARRKRVEAIMLRTRQAKQKKDDDKSPTDDNKSMDESESKSGEGKMTENLSDSKLSEKAEAADDKESEYELSVRQREEDLMNMSARHNQTAAMSQSLSANQDDEAVTSNGVNPLQNGMSVSTNGTAAPKDNSIVETDLTQSNNKYNSQNGHSKNEINELSNFFNTSENQFNNLALDNTVKQNIVTNNILDISDLDLLNTANSNNVMNVSTNGNLPMQTQPDVANQLIDVSVDTITKNLINEDSINSNQSNNSPFITSFQDNQENRDVSLL